MIAKDFCYDNQYLSDYGFIICKITSSNSGITVEEGQKLTFNKRQKSGGYTYAIASANYNACYTTTFEICKNPKIHRGKEMIITSDEFRDIMRWLNRRKFLQFYSITDDESETQYFNASFNVKKIIIRDKLIGISLEMLTDSPVGFGQQQTFNFNVSDTSTTFLLSDVSDELGYIYPDVEIEISRNGNLQIDNLTYGETTIIKNCVMNEKIRIYGAGMIIETDNDGHKQTLTRDFNFVFPKIQNDIKNRQNKFKFSLPCKVRMKYTPIIR